MTEANHELDVQVQQAYAVQAETAAYSPEQQLIANIRDAVAEAIEFTPGLEQVAIAALQSATQDIAAQQLLPADRERVKFAGNFLLWASFVPKDPFGNQIPKALPDGIKVSAQKYYPSRIGSEELLTVGNDIALDFDVKDDIDGGVRRAIGETDAILCMRACQGNILADPNVAATIGNYVDDLPLFRFLATFNEKNTAVGERSLRPFELRAKQATLEQDIRLRHGLGAKALLNGTPKDELNRAFMQLDEHKVPDIKTALPNDPANKLHEFILSYSRQHVVDQLADDSIQPGSQLHLDQISWDSDRGVIFLNSDGSNIAPFFLRKGVDLEHSLTSSILASIGASKKYVHNPGYKVQQETLGNIYGNFGNLIKTDTSYGDRLKLWRQSAINEIQRSISQLFEYSPYQSKIDPSAVLWLRGFDWADASINQLNEADTFAPKRGLRLSPNRRQDAIISLEEYELAKQSTLGWAKRSGLALTDTAERLIQFLPATENLPQNVRYSDLTIQREDITYALSALPYVDGYRLVADNRRGQYQFVRDVANDSYVKRAWADEPFERRFVIEMAFRYENIGMGELAQALIAEPDMLTPRLLVKLVQDSMDYSFDDSIITQDINGLLSDFMPQIQNGRLQTQCTGAAQFLSVSFNHLLNKESAQIVIGSVLPVANGRISQVGHAEVALVRHGERMIFDATPASSIAAASGVVGNAMRPGANELRMSFRDKLSHRRAVKNAAQAMIEQATDSENETEATAELQLSATEELRQRLVEQNTASRAEISKRVELFARTTLHVPAELPSRELYRLATKLSVDDPLRQLLSQSIRDDVAESEVAKLRQWITDVQKADPAILSRRGIRQYQPHTLKNLAHLTDELAQARR